MRQEVQNYAAILFSVVEQNILLHIRGANKNSHSWSNCFSAVKQRSCGANNIQLSNQHNQLRSKVPSGVELAKSGGRVPHRNVQRFRGGLVFKAHRLCVSLNSRLESNKEEERSTVVPLLLTMLGFPPPPAFSLGALLLRASRQFGIPVD